MKFRSLDEQRVIYCRLTDLSTHHRHLLVEKRPLVATIHDHQLLELSHYNRGKPVGGGQAKQIPTSEDGCSVKGRSPKSSQLSLVPSTAVRTELLDLAIVAEDREQPRTRVM